MQTGELVDRLRGSFANFDPLPDADNAAVGSYIMGFLGTFRRGVSLCLLYLPESVKLPE